MNPIRSMRPLQPRRLASFLRPRQSISTSLPRLHTQSSFFRLHPICTSIPPRSHLSGRRYSTKTNYNPLPPIGHTIFHLFPKTFPDGPPPNGRFAIDYDLLKSEYLENYHNPPDPEQNSALAKDVLPTLSTNDRDCLTMAYNILSDPVERSIYILHLRGISLKDDKPEPTDDELAAMFSENDEDVDWKEEETLEAIYEVQERVEEGLESEEGARALVREMEGRLGELEGELDELFKGERLEDVERGTRLARCVRGAVRAGYEFLGIRKDESGVGPLKS